jgi:hypothetical protein
MSILSPSNYRSENRLKSRPVSVVRVVRALKLSVMRSRLPCKSFNKCTSDFSQSPVSVREANAARAAHPLDYFGLT